MSLEGRLRELALAEVLQLLSLGKKSGTLRLQSTLTAREASVVMDEGWIVDAIESGTNDVADVRDSRSVSDRVLDLLQWTDGDFRFTPHNVDDSVSRARIPTDLLLMESARRADAWLTLGDSIPGPHAVPAFLDVQPAKLPLLHLAPDQWEVLTRIDGVRTITELARDLRRDLVDVAQTLHDLVNAGVLTFVRLNPAATEFSLPTPPSVRAVDRNVVTAPRQTIPPVYSPVMPFALPFEAGDDDSLFDPMQVGVMTPDGMPATARNTKPAGTVSHTARPVSQALRHRPSGTERADTSNREAIEATVRELVMSGDHAAATGNLSQACVLWEQALAVSGAQDAHAAVRERIMLARRLEALMHSSTRN